MTVRYYGENRDLAREGLRRCTTCDRVLPLDDYTPAPSMAAGRYPTCRACHRRQGRDYTTGPPYTATSMLHAIREDNARRTDGLRRCTGCDRVLPVWRFYGRRQHRCSKCSHGVSEGPDSRAARNRGQAALLARGLRRCVGCDRILALDQFYANGRPGSYQSRCKPCYGARCAANRSAQNGRAA